MRTHLTNIEVPSLPADRHLTTISGSLRVVTPMYGGGVTPGLSQLEDLARAPAIRGGLRFWWRCLFGHNYASVKELSEAEFALFGGIGDDTDALISSRVSIATSVGEKPSRAQGHNYTGKRADTKPHEIRIDGVDLSYVLFPESTKELSEQRFSQQFYYDFTFTLRVICDRTDDLPIVAETLRAWVTFGGLGARTRRGLGQVVWETPPELEPPGEHPHGFWRPAEGVETATWLGTVLHQRTATPQGDLGIPLLSGSEAYLGPSHFGRGIEALGGLVSEYQAFRQKRRSGAHPGRPGRSYWPEPDTIRYATRRTRHHAPLFDDHPCYPRGQFGLPIVFHFQGPEGHAIGNQELVWSTFRARPDVRDSPNSRFASPMVFFVLKEGGRFLAGVLRLSSPLPSGHVQLKDRGGSRADVTKSFPPDTSAAPDKFQTTGPLVTYDAIDDFVGSLNGFTKCP